MLDQWLGYLKPERFFDRHWGKQEALLSTWHALALKIVFSLEEFESLLNNGRLRFPQVQCFDGGSVVSPSLYTYSTHASMSDMVNPALLREQIRQNRTIRISGIHTLSSSLNELASKLSESFGCEVKMNAYYCQGPVGGLAGHYDGHHIFAAQIAGQKIWKLGPIVIDSPDRDFRPRPINIPPTIKTIITKPGYVLYMPPGMWHEVYTEDVSLHLSIGIHPWTWSDCIEKLFLASRQRHPLLRAALPFSIVNGRCIYRMEVKQELDALFDLLKMDIPDTMEEQLADALPAVPLSLPTPAANHPVSELHQIEGLSGLVDVLWNIANSPVSLYLRGNVPRSLGQPSSCWDLDVVLVVMEMDSITRKKLSSARDDLRQTYSHLPSLDLFCCTKQELLASEELLQVQVVLAETAVLVRGENLIPAIQRLPLDAALAGRLGRQIRPRLERKIASLEALSEDVNSSRTASLCKSVLRIASVPVIRDDARFVRDPTECFFEIVERFPDQIENAEIILQGLFGYVPDRKSIIMAARELINRIL